MRPLRRSFAKRSVLVSAFAGVALALGVGGVDSLDSATAHVKHPTRDQWFFSAHTYDMDDNAVDPMTFIFHGGGAHYSLSSIKNQIQQNFPTGGEWGEWSCNADQGMFYRLIQYGTAPPERYAWKNDQYTSGESDLTDLNMSTNRKCVTQNHVRIWDDYDHYRVYGGQRDKWAVGSIHHETRCPIISPPPTPIPPSPFDAATPYLCSVDEHKRDRTFEQQARNLGWMLRTYGNYCVEKQWKALPGSFSPRSSGVDFSDGYLTRMTLVPPAGSTTCADQ